MDLSPAGPVNPYAAPDAPIGEAAPATPGDPAADEAIRRAHMSHEANVKSIGSLHILGAVLILATVVVLATSFPPGGGRAAFDLQAVIAIYAVMFALNVALGVGLNRLQPWARWTEAALVSLALLSSLAASAVGLAVRGALGATQIIASAVGWGIMGLILYLLLSPRGTMVFSREYRGVIARTPHVKYQTGCVAKSVLAVILIVLIVAMLRAFVM